MKNMTLLLGSLLLVGSIANAKEVVTAPTPAVEQTKEVVVEPVVIVEEAAKPWIRLTSLGQEVEVENNSGKSNIGESVYFANIIGLATDNWDFAVQAGRFWNVDTDKGIKKTDTRMQLDAWRNFKAESFKYSLGARWRAQKSMDRFYLRGKYSSNSGMFAGWIDYFYNSNTGSNDSNTVEVMPLNVKLGPLTLGYFLAHSVTLGDSDAKSTEHQLRAYLPLYKGEKIAFNLENRLTLHKEGKQANGNSLAGLRGGEYDFGGRNRTYLKVNYKVTPALQVYGHYAYEIQDAKDFGRDTYYGNFVAGWNYKF